MSDLKVEVLTPSRALLRATARRVTLPTVAGQISVLPGHRTLVTLLEPGLLEIAGADGAEFVAVGSGAAEIGADGVRILPERAERASDIDLEAARRALDSHREQHRDDNLFRTEATKARRDEQWLEARVQAANASQR